MKSAVDFGDDVRDQVEVPIDLVCHAFLDTAAVRCRTGELVLMLCKLLDKVVAVSNELFDGSISELFVASKYVSDVAVVFVCFLSVDKVVSVARLDRHSDALFDELRLFETVSAFVVHCDCSYQLEQRYVEPVAVRYSGLKTAEQLR